MILVCAILVVGCTATTKEELTESGLKRSDFQTEVDGEKTDLFVLKNKNNMEVCSEKLRKECNLLEMSIG